jgi:hypothetical protein
LRGAKAANDFFKGTKYTDKVLAQMKKGDHHSFPESVKAFQDSGKIVNVTGKDGIVRETLKIQRVAWMECNGIRAFVASMFPYSAPLHTGYLAGLDSNGTWQSAFRNPKTGKFTGGHESSRNWR